ncbi:hydroxymethylbilane synthase [Anaerobacillus alkalidiazotrophicus]|uniref:Porphobilinogen deaminase n=1 Tax=Anaerobacillus alkalidiazotrophicus TaxID=472963 RepID=A0A1S2M1G3_9BACI|nr:hydroxymethylbilane synthase [Anaerobacillus alkalidiazotrophicus]OIJ18350.1 hydroxymethylbilane synthase [Anaerobacillus alkalidiazotrophicus]OIJ19829.1 hydroxymethylbilane synthase [Anaerobacillus alkalidiazotrophicus]
MRKIIVGSRQSQLALTQTNWVIDQLKKLGAPFDFEVKKIVTKGDQILNVTLSKVGGKGLFVKEIEQAMLNKEIDMAVHSMKDMPAILQEGLTIGSVPKRVDPRDAWISNNGKGLMEIEAGSVVGTSSLRRSAQVLAKRPDLEVKWIRGNIDSRLRKCREGEYDAIILAAAGLARMGWSADVVTEYISTELCLPAVGQGALGIECRADDVELKELLNKFTDENTNRCVMAERAFLHKIEGGCQVPIAGYAELNENDEIVLVGLVGSPDGKVILHERMVGKDAQSLGEQLAVKLLDKGAKEILDEVIKELEK